ncbi:MAG TPA: ABC transporter ATP-binding protein [Chthoniobacteraceae bacterium]|nr:ABC transporter ATP-binding protein [Chthoniobacteraceae bacterium]
MIRFEHLGKTFKGRCALEDLTLEIPKGEIFGLLGHNGAGKSTTFGMLLGQVHPTTGEAFIRGVSVQRERGKALRGVGAIFETPGFYDYLSGWANLRIFTGYTAKLSNAELEETVRFVGLDKRIHDPVRVYSHGMRQRLALAQALLPRPELVLLDEPAEGLDPEGIHEMRHLILRLNREHGMTVLLSSHQLAEVEQLCNNGAILNQGRLVFHGKWSDLATGNARYHIQLADWVSGRVILEKCGAIIVSEGVIELPDGKEIADVVTALVMGGARVNAVEQLRQTLEELYLKRISKA